MKKEECILLGKIIKVQGYQGVVQVKLQHQSADDLSRTGHQKNKLETVFLIIDGIPVPFFIEEILSTTGERAILKLEGVDTREDAVDILGSAVYIRKTSGVRGNERENLKKFAGFIIYDTMGNEIGKIVDVQNMAGNRIFLVDHLGEERMIPAHMDLVIDINDRDETIIMELPDGLFGT